MASLSLLRRLSTASSCRSRKILPSVSTSQVLLSPFLPFIYSRQTHTDSETKNSIEVKNDVDTASETGLNELAVSPDSMEVPKLNTKESNFKYTAFSSLKTSSRHDLAMVFTCKVCETRSVKTTCRESYEKGIVIARCAGCNNLHLIADRLGWFGEPGSIEDFLAARGEEVKRGAADTLNLTLEDLAGLKS